MKKFIYYIAIFSFISLGCSGDDNSVELPNEAPESRACESTNSLVGQSRELRVSNTYGISGLITIVSDCEIEITDFFYNGSGPNVSFYGGLNGNYRDGINLSDPIDGRRFEGETVNLFLPDGLTFDDINSFSVWCFEFNVNFSSATFQQ